MGQLSTQWCRRRPVLFRFGHYELHLVVASFMVPKDCSSPRYHIACRNNRAGRRRPSQCVLSSWHLLCSHHEVWVSHQLLHQIASQEIAGPLIKKFINQDFFGTWQWSQQLLHVPREWLHGNLNGHHDYFLPFSHILRTTLKSPSHHYALKGSWQKPLALSSTGPSPA